MLLLLYETSFVLTSLVHFPIFSICPTHQGSYNGWLTSLYFASATMSTVGYGDVTVLVNYDADFESTSPYPQNWRIFIATIYMILSLVVSVVGFQAGLDSHFHPFRRRADIFGKRVYEILRDANIVKGSQCKLEDIVSRMRFAKFSQLTEISLIFLILNLVGVFAVQLSLMGENKDEFVTLTWMESLYWAVQTTTTIGYGGKSKSSDVSSRLLHISFLTKPPFSLDRCGDSSHPSVVHDFLSCH